MRKRNGTAVPSESGDPQYVRFRLWRDVWHRLTKNKLSVIGLIWLILVILCAIFAAQIAPYGYDDQDISRAFTAPCMMFPLGTDNFGRDILSRVIFGAQISVKIGFVVVSISLLVGGFLGAMAAYFKRVDNLIMRTMDLFMAVPGTLLALVIATALGTGMVNLMIAVGISQIPQYARVVRSACMSVKNSEFIEAAQCIGATDRRIIIKHILPNALAPIIVQATLSVADAIITAAAMSFLGLGVQAPFPEWGAMLSGTRQFLRLYPYMAIGPGLAIMLLTYSLNLLGDGLRDALDPRLKT